MADKAQIEGRISLGIAEAAELMPLSESSLYKAAVRGETPFKKVGGRWQATPEDLKEWVRGTRPEPKRDLMAEVVQLRKESA